MSLRGAKTPGIRTIRMAPIHPPTAAPMLDPAALRAAFDAVAPLTIGLEEEAMLLDPARSHCCRGRPT